MTTELSYGVAVNTTSKCGRHCKYCMCQGFMRKYPDYELSKKQFTKFVTDSFWSGYQFANIDFVGGDPLLWEHLEWALDLVNEFPVARSTGLFTNGRAIRYDNIDKIMNIAKKVGFFKISRYGDNDDNIRIAKKHLGNLTNLSVHEKTVFTKPPVVPISSNPPSQCSCDSLGLVGDDIYICPNLYVHLVNFPQFDAPGLVTKVKKGYLDELDIANRYNKIHCSVCVSNVKNASKMKETLNEVGGW